MRRKIYDSERALHFVTFSCYRRRSLLDTAQARRIVLGTLNAQLDRLAGRCAGFVLMPEHVHALLWFPESGLLSECLKQWKRMSSVGIQKLLQTTLVAYTAELPKREPVWQPRYYDFNVYSPRKLEEKLRYMHENPVRRGLVEKAIQWRWSSARHYELGRTVGVPIHKFD